jgi:hypothetical protein
VKLKILKHSWIDTSIGVTPKDSTLIKDIFDEETKNVNANGDYDDDHVRMSTSNMKKMTRMRKEKKRQNTKILMKKLTINNLNNVMRRVHQKMFINIIDLLYLLQVLLKHLMILNSKNYYF